MGGASSCDLDAATAPLRANDATTSGPAGNLSTPSSGQDGEGCGHDCGRGGKESSLTGEDRLHGESNSYSGSTVYLLLRFVTLEAFYAIDRVVS